MTGIVETKHVHPINPALAACEATRQVAHKYQARYITGRGPAIQRFVEPIDGIHAHFDGVSLSGVI